MYTVWSICWMAVRMSAAFPRLATLLKKGLIFGSHGIAGEKKHTLTQVGMMLGQHGIEIHPIKSWHKQIA